MERHFKIGLLLSAATAILLTAVLYIIDNDPPYKDWWRTLSELGAIAIILFGLIWCCCIVFYGLYKGAKKLFR